MNRPNQEWLLETVVDQAAEWFNRHRSGEDLTAGEQDAFLDWLRASPLNVHGYLEVARMATALPEALAGLDRGPVQGTGRWREVAEPGNVVPLSVLAAVETCPAAQCTPVPSRPYRLFAAVVIMAVFSAFLTLTMGDVSQHGKGLQHVIVGSYPKMRAMPDGSTVYVNSGTELRVRYSQSARSVELIKGEALFKVVHNAAWPFRVLSGGAEIVDVGTMFDLSRSPGRTTITVLQGKVEVLQHGSAVEARIDSQFRPQVTPLHLSAGEQVQVGPAIPAPQVVTTDVRHVTDWLHRNISFDNRPLGEVIEEINRYAPVQVRIEKPQLRKLRVNGVLDVYDTSSLLLFLKRYGDIKRTEDAIVVSGGGPAPDESATSAAP